MNKYNKMIFIILVACLAFFGAGSPIGALFGESEDSHAVCVLKSVDDQSVKGIVYFTELDVDRVKIKGEFKEVSEGLHGFHIHEHGDLTNGCASTGGHYNPYSKDHGGRDSGVRHAGDLGNVEIGSDGKGTIDIVDMEVKITGLYSVIGRACLLHAGEDDLGAGGDEGSRKTGNAGARIACGIIGLM